MNNPSLTFFCELEDKALAELFRGRHVLQFLQKLNANLSLGLLDLSDSRAEVVSRLNKAGIPVTAWLLLPREQGYWTNLDNVDESIQAYRVFRRWTERHHLRFAAVGLDIEPRLQQISALTNGFKGQLPALLKRFLRIDGLRRQAEKRLNALLELIRLDGYAVETYQFPTVLDERRAGSDVFARSLGLPVLDADREVLMLYSSFFPQYSDSILWSYAQECRAVGVGSTGGGVEINGMQPLKTLRWIDLRRDLLIAAQRVDHIYIFSLEGCVWNKFCERLLDLNWDSPIYLPKRTAAGISLLRRLLQGVLWICSHPLQSLIGLIAISWGYRTMRGWFKR